MKNGCSEAFGENVLFPGWRCGGVLEGVGVCGVVAVLENPEHTSKAEFVVNFRSSRVLNSVVAHVWG